MLRVVGELRGGDGITLARIAGVCSRRAAQTLGGQCSDADAMAELTHVAAGRLDLLTRHAGIRLGSTEGELSVTLAMSREQARLCILAGADPDALGPWIDLGRERARQASKPPFSGTGGQS
jgi:hypothetical protein